MDELINQLTIILASGYQMYFRAHVSHWNVMGSNFPQYHEFMGDIYEDVFESLDDIAENIRKVDGFIPMSFSQLLNADNTPEAMLDPQARDMDMLSYIQSANDTMIENLRAGIGIADSAGEPAISNFLQDRLGAHQKIAWKLKSTISSTYQG